MKNKKGFGKRISAWLLTFVMVLSLVMVPSRKVEAAETITVSGTDVITATDSGVYVSYISELEFAANVWGTGSPAVDLYKYEFTLHNNTGTTISDWEVKITPNSNAYWNSGWNGATYDYSTGSVVLGTYKGTGEDGSTWSTAEVASGSTVTGMGAQCRANILEGATIVLTYNVGSSTEAPSVDDTATDPSTIGSTSDKVTATVTQTSQSYDYYQYEIAVSNGLSETISDWIVMIPVTGITSSSAWDGSWAKVKWSYDDSYIYVTSNSGETISSGGTLSGESYKIQYSGSSALSTNEAVVYYKTGSGSTGAFDSVISAGTQPSGSSSSGNSSSGEVFDGSNIGTIDTSLDYNFAKLLQHSLYFYDANMCGDQVSETSLYSKDLYNGWRGDCHVNDKFTYNGTEYSAVGGYHDAGDHVKFGLPMSQAMTALGMSYYEFGQAFDELGQKNHLKTITDYYCTYVKSCTVLNAAGTQAEAFCYQVGHGDKDHASWVAPEVEDESATERTYTLVATSSNPATDIVGGTAAALTLNYLNFGNEEDLKYAKALFAFAKNNSKAEADYQGGFYHSGWGGWQDEYCLAAALLYIATNDSSYATEYTSNDANNGNIEKPYGWENAYQAAVFYAPDSSGNKTSHTNTIRNWFNTTANNSSSGYYCGDSWGSARVNCNVQFMMMVSDKHAGTNTYGSWCRYQMSQILGNNSIGKNLVCGYNTNSPTKPHHRAASGYSGWTDFNNNATQKYTLYGALCGGPTRSDFSTYNDAVNDAVSNEVALDYNACLVGSAAALYLLNKDSTDAGFTNQTIHADFYGGSNFTLAGEENATKPTGVTLDAASQELVVGETFTLVATVAPEDASQSVTWSSSDTSVATVNSSGVVTAKANGTATITATTVAKMESGESATATCTVTVKKPAELTSSASSLVCQSIEYGYTSVYTASASVINVGGVATTPSNTSLESGMYFEIVSMPTGVSISPTGASTISVKPKTGLAAGTYTDKVIIAYSGKTLTIPVSVTVTKKPIVVKANDAEMTYGEAVPTLSVDSSYEDSLVVGDTLSYQVTTTATTLSDAGTYPISLTVTSNANYEITTQNGTLTIHPKAVSQVNFPTAAALTVGQTLADSVLTGGSTEYGSFAWKNSSMAPSRGTSSYDVVLTLSDNAIKNYSFTSIDGYNSSTGTITREVSINVNREGLEVVFPTATDITYGQALKESSFVGGQVKIGNDTYPAEDYGTFTWENADYVPTESEIGTIQKYVIFTWSDASKTQYGLEDDEMTSKEMVTIKVNKQTNANVPATPVLASRTANRITVNEINGVEYSKDGVNWQTSGTFAGLSAFTSYKIYARYKETTTQYASATCSTPLQVYTLVINPYTVDVSKLSGSEVDAYVDALRVNGSSEPTVAYADNVLTLQTANATYTLVGINENLKVCVPNDSTTIQVVGTSTVSSIVSSTTGDVKITGNGTLKADYIEIKGTITINGPTLVVEATGTGKAAISAGSIVIEESKVTATGDSGNPAMKADTITIISSEVIATGGAGAAAIEATEGIAIENADVKVNAGAGSTDKAIVSDNIILKGENNITTDGGMENLYSSTPKDENGNIIATYTVVFLEEDGTTTIDSMECYAGSAIVLPELEDVKGCVVRWKEKSTGNLYQGGISYTVKGDVTFTVNVTKIKVTHITLDSTAETLEVGDGVALAETVLPANAYDASVTWSSSNTAVATVDAEGAVTAVAEGTAIITATANDGSGVSATCTITVVNGDIAVEQIKITGDTKKVAPGKKIKLTAMVYPENATNQNVEWKVSNSKYASVNSKGVVTTKKAGKGKKVTVTAYSQEDNSIVATYKISIMKNAVKKIKLSAKTTTLKKGKSVTIKAKFTPAKGISKELTWSTSNKKVATVNAKGKVTAKKKGTVKITAKAKDGSGKKATIKIKVK